MKKLIFLFAIVFLINGCSKDDSQTTKEQQEQIIDGGSVKTSQLVVISNNSIGQEQYNATLGNQSIIIVKTSHNELSFIVPSDIELGNQLLTIPDLNNLKVNYQISETILTGNADENFTPFLNNIDNYLATLQNTNTFDKVTQIKNSLLQTFNNLNDADKIKMAKTYQANKDYFNNMMNNDFTSRLSNSTNQYPIAFQISVFAAAASAVIAITYPEPITKTLFVAATGVAIYKAHQYGLDFTNIDNIKVGNTTLGGIISTLQRSSNNSTLSFNTGVEASILFEAKTRAVIASDVNDNNSNFTNFFNIHSIYNSTVNDLNEVIIFLNDTFFFSDIDNLSNLTINQNNPIVTNTADAPFFENNTFSIDDNNISIDNISFSNGNLNMTLSIINPDAVTSDFIETNLNFQYHDNFNDITGSFPIKVFKENSIDIVGVWIMNEPSNDISCTSGSYWNGGIAIEFYPNGTLNWGPGTFSGTYEINGNNLSLTFSNTVNSNTPCNGVGTNIANTITYTNTYDGVYNGVDFNGSFSHNTDYLIETGNCTDDNCNGAMRLFRQ